MKVLKAKWNKKESDIEIFWDNTLRSNVNYLFSEVFNDDFQKEMKERGFDIKTLKFEIKGFKNEKN